MSLYGPHVSYDCDIWSEHAPDEQALLSTGNSYKILSLDMAMLRPRPPICPVGPVTCQAWRLTGSAASVATFV